MWNFRTPANVTEPFAQILAVGGKSNSLGRASEVIKQVLQDRSRLAELYRCLFEKDPWTRMRAADSVEKICREHPDWLAPYIGKLQAELSASTQPSIQWHLAQIYRQVDLDTAQKAAATMWLEQLISTPEVDWIVAANVMDTLMQFVQDGSVTTTRMIALLRTQQHHKSSAVTKRAAKHLAKLGAEFSP